MRKRLAIQWKRVRDFFYRRGLQFTLVLTFTLASSLAILIVTMGYSRQFYSATEQIARTNSVNVIDQVNLSLDDYIHRLMSISTAAYFDVLKDADLSQDIQNISDGLNFLLETNDTMLLNISVFRNDGTLVNSQPANQLKKDADPAKQEWFVNANSQIENVHFSKPYVDNLFPPVNNVYHWVVSLSRSVELTNNGDVERGVLLVNLNFSGIEKISTSADFGKSGYIYIMDAEGSIIFHPKQQLIYGGLLLENSNQASRYSEGTHKEVFQGEERIITVKTMGYTGWKVIGVMPTVELRDAVTASRYLLWGIAVGVIVFLIGVNSFISSKVSTPLRRLERAVSRIEQDINDVAIPVEGTYEIRHLSETLITMTRTMQHLMRNIVKQQEKIRTKEIGALQAQINPHFLYNTLDSTIWMIESGRYDGAITMISALAKFFRISLSKGKNIIPLEDEIEHVRSYLTIQEIRYKNKFSSAILVDESIEKAATIKLIIQPIVENAIYHAMDYMMGDGEISIRAYRYEEIVYIDIEDNGPGMTREQIDMLKAGKGYSRKGSGLGFRNVEERIKLYYGQEYGLEVLSEPDEGTLVRIHIPFQMIGEEGQNE